MAGDMARLRGLGLGLSSQTRLGPLGLGLSSQTPLSPLGLGLSRSQTEGGGMATIGWNLVVCSDFYEPLVIFVPDPGKWTVEKLKVEVQNKLPPRPSLGAGVFTLDSYMLRENSDLIFYCDERLIPAEKALNECAGMKNGVALLMVVKPFIVNVYCPHLNETIKVEVPRRQLKTWNVSTLRKAICFNLGIDVSEAKHDILASKGESLTKEMNIYATLENNSLLTYTRLEQFEVQKKKFSQKAATRSKANQQIFLPFGTKTQFASSYSVYNEDVRSVNDDDHVVWQKFWNIHIQRLDTGFSSRRTMIRLNYDPVNVSIFKLREIIRDSLAVPTYQQMLTVGNVVLEDWNNDGRQMYIKNYPALHNGSTICLVRLVDGIHVKPLNTCNDVAARILAAQMPKYINVHVPDEFKLSTLAAIMTTPGGRIGRKIYLYKQNTWFECHDQRPVSSVAWIIDGCTLEARSPDTCTAAGFFERHVHRVMTEQLIN